MSLQSRIRSAIACPVLDTGRLFPLAAALLLAALVAIPSTGTVLALAPPGDGIVLFNADRDFVERKKKGEFVASPVFDREIENLFYAVRDADTGDWITTMYQVKARAKKLSEGWEYSWEYPALKKQPELDHETPYPGLRRPEGDWLRFWGSARLGEGEGIDYSLPLHGQVPSVTVSREDGLGQAGALTFNHEQIPYPLLSVEGELRNVRLASLVWTSGAVRGTELETVGGGQRPHLDRLRPSHRRRPEAAAQVSRGHRALRRGNALPPALRTPLSRRRGHPLRPGLPVDLLGRGPIDRRLCRRTSQVESRHKPAPVLAPSVRTGGPSTDQ